MSRIIGAPVNGTQIGVRVDDEMLRLIDDQARKRQCPRAAVMRQIIHDWFAEHDAGARVPV